MSYVILMPFTHQQYADDCIATMAPELVENLVQINNIEAPGMPRQLGAAGAYNIGARTVLNEGLDWLITLSPTTRFGAPGGRDFVDYMESVSDHAWVVEAGMPTGWHFIAWHRRVFERIGLWDENFWPVYGEDADISHRILVAIEEDGVRNVWKRFEINAWIMMQGYSAHIGGVRHSQEKIWQYYVEKWGGRSGHEKWKRPFGDKPLGFWEPNYVKYE